VGENFDPAHRRFVSYIDKSREFYATQGYETPYRWARFDDVPFTALAKPLAELRLGVVTTSTLLADGAVAPQSDGDPGDFPGVVHTGPMDPPPGSMYTDNRSWDKDATHTNDTESFLPARRLREYVEQGRLGSLSPRFYSVPTEYSQRGTREADAPEIARLMREDGVDVAMLAPL
jgi:hypothetical protein